MDWIVIADVKPWDGRYEFDLNGSPLKQREWGWLKRFADYVPATLTEHTYSDPEVLGVFAICALYRAGKIEPRDVPDLWERFQDTTVGAAIRWELGDRQEADDVEDPTAGSNGNANSSGDSSQTGSGTPEPTPKRTGHPASAISGSDLATSVT